jgi:phosphoglycolate phosphatase
MRPGDLEAVIFDMDGTLIFSKVDYERMRREIANFLLSRGIDPFSEDFDWYEVTHGGENIREMGFPEEKVSEILMEITKIQNRAEIENINEVSMVPRTDEILKRMKEMGLKIGVATRSHREFAIRALRMTGLLRFVDAIVARDEALKAKPAPEHLEQVADLLAVELSKSIFIGDTISDVFAARNANIRFLAALWGSTSYERLWELGARQMVLNITDLFDHLDKGKIPCAPS